MAEFLPSPVDRPPRHSWFSSLGYVLALALVTVLVKPWDAFEAPAGTAAAPRTPRPTPTAPPERVDYDPRLFGGREPDPAWELWPAGYVVQFGMAGPLPVRDGAEPGASPAPGTSGGPGPGESAAPLPSPSPAGPASPPPSLEPPDADVVDLGPADHLIALGINTPADVRVDDIELLFHAGEGCCLEPVSIVRLPTPWPSRHFFVIGIADPARPGEAAPWRIGDYRLDLVLGSGETRMIMFRVRAPLG